MDSETRRTVGVVIERRPAASRWAEHVWRVVDILDGAAESQPFSRLSTSPDGRERFFAGNMVLTLYRQETDAYRINLEGDRVLYVVLRNDESGTQPFVLHSVTASPRDACDHLDSSEDLVEAVPMPPAILEWLAAFHAVHHQEEPFVKRKRDRVDVERLQFSKEPIFARTGRFVGGDSGGSDD